MLFNTLEFIFIFLPITLCGFYYLGRKKHYELAMGWLTLMSFVYYARWKPSYVILIMLSIVFNFLVGRRLGRDRCQSKKMFLIFGLIFNLGFLAYYKYANFFIENVNLLAGSQFHLETIILPLAISFFTFQQITYLVDSYRNETREYSFFHYCLFVTFFPQLIAGPIVHHKEMLPQFEKKSIFNFNTKLFSIGVTVFFIGLFKKVILADSMIPYVNPVFSAFEQGINVTFLDAWCGALAYSFQLYFDFSGYSDMAIGIANMFGILLPINFLSPYKATSIIDFWRRWHITLSRFLRDYLYIPLGGNRKGKNRRIINLFITMLLGGLWHGAGWTFVVWGALHGVYLMINHLWRSFKQHLNIDSQKTNLFSLHISRTVTFVFVVIAWVFFRSDNISTALTMTQTMFGTEGFHLSSEALYEPKICVLWLIALLIVSWFLPNTQEFMSIERSALNQNVSTYKGKLKFNFSLFWAIILSLVAVYTVASTSQTSSFLYFNF